MNPEQIIEEICGSLEGVLAKASWGETSLFYNPGKVLPNGVYFCTLKDKNGDNDKASNLGREGVYRLSIGLQPKTYIKLFGAKPVRPPKGGIVVTGHDFQELDILMPHPIYAWMAWAQILSPSRASFEAIRPLVDEAYNVARLKFEKKQLTRRSTRTV
jgi:hypothetical protein